MRTLPNRLKYDYERRVLAKELSKNIEDEASSMKALPTDKNRRDYQSIEPKRLSIQDSSNHIAIPFDKKAEQIKRISQLSKDDMKIVRDELRRLSNEVLALEILKYVKEKRVLKSKGILTGEAFVKFDEVTRDINVLSSAIVASDGIMRSKSSDLDKLYLDLIMGLEVVMKYQSHANGFYHQQTNGDIKVIVEAIMTPPSELLIKTNDAMSKQAFGVDEEESQYYYSNSNIQPLTKSATANYITPFNFEIETQEAVGIGENEANVVDSSASFIETTAESFETKEDKAKKVALTTIDVTLFLLEKTISTVSSLIQDRGGLALDRIIQAYHLDDIVPLTMTRFQTTFRTMNSKKNQTIGTWKLLGQLRKRSERMQRINA